MLPLTADARRWLSSPRGLMWALATTTALSAGALTWFGWEVLEQERTVEAERERERLANRADQVAQAIDRTIGAATEALMPTDDGPTSPAPRSDPLATDGLLLVLSPSGVDAVPPGRLSFYPTVPDRPEPPISLFADGEVAEFRQNDLARAIGVYRALARGDPAVRAASLMRLGGVQRKARQLEAARATYEAMAALGDVPVGGLPADLVARERLFTVENDLGLADATEEKQALVRFLRALTGSRSQRKDADLHGSRRPDLPFVIAGEADVLTVLAKKLD